MKTIEYNVIENSDLEDLIFNVQEMIESGWHPIGGVAIQSGKYNYFYQAIVKHAE